MLSGAFLSPWSHTFGAGASGTRGTRGGWSAWGGVRCVGHAGIVSVSSQYALVPLGWGDAADRLTVFQGLVFPVSWVEWVVVYRAVLADHHASTETVRLRGYQVLRLEAGFPGGPATVTSVGLRAWVGDQPWAAATVRSYVAGFRGFFAWWSGVTGSVDPALGLPMVPMPAYRPRPTPDKVVDRAVLECEPRTRLMIVLAADAGLRRGESSRVHPRDVHTDSEGSWLRVHGKGARERTLPIRDSLAESLTSHGTEFVFPGRDRGHLSAGHVGVLVERGLDSPGWTAHTLRHRFATRLYRATRDLYVVQRFLGHARPETTQVYVEMDRALLREGLLRLTPTTEVM